MLIGELAIARAGVIAPGRTLVDAARLLETNDVGALAVVTQDFLIGVITESDLARAVAAGENPADATVREYMTPGPSTLTVDDDVQELLALLGRGVHHVPVLDRGVVRGFVGPAQLLRSMVPTDG